MMNASSGMELSAECAVLLSGFGLEGEDLDGPLDPDGMVTPESIAREATADSPEAMYESLQTTLARSARGIESPLRYWNQAPAYQLTDALAPFGYEVEFPDDPDPGPDGEFEVVLTGDGRERRMTFSYPESEYGTDNYPALVDAVQRRLVPDDDLEFVLLDRDDAWWFVLVEDERLSALRNRFGRRIRAFDRPLLAERQPADFGADTTVPDPVAGAGDDPGIDGVVVESGIEDAFERVEREAATQPVRPESGEEDLDEEVRALVGGDEPPAVTDVSAERLDDLVEADGDRLVFDTPSGADAGRLQFDLDRTPARHPGDRRRSSDGDPDDDGRARLSEQVAECLSPEVPDATTPEGDGTVDRGPDGPRGDGTPVFTAADAEEADAEDEAPEDDHDGDDEISAVSRFTESIRDLF